MDKFDRYWEFKREFLPKEDRDEKFLGHRVSEGDLPEKRHHSESVPLYLREYGRSKGFFEPLLAGGDPY